MEGLRGVRTRTVLPCFSFLIPNSLLQFW